MGGETAQGLWANTVPRPHHLGEITLLLLIITLPIFLLPHYLVDRTLLLVWPEEFPLGGIFG